MKTQVQELTLAPNIIEQIENYNEAKRKSPLHASRLMTQSFVDSKDNKTLLKKLLKEMELFRDGLFGIEQRSKVQIEELILILRHRIWALNNCNPLSEDYLWLDYGMFFKWRDAKKFPTFAIYSLDNQHCTMTHAHHQKSRGDGHPYLRPGGFESLPSDLREKLIDICSDVYKQISAPFHDVWRSYSIDSAFQGTIPAETRKKIIEAKAHFGTNIFIIAEANWKTNHTNPDPLVVGWDGKEMWLIDVFDLTKLEAELLAFSSLGKDN